MAERTCAIDGCDGQMYVRGWCSMHYQRWRKHGDPLMTLVEPHEPTCSIEACDKPYSARGLCGTHYARWLKHGSTELRRETLPPGLCSVEDCDRLRHYSNGLCKLHHKRWMRHRSTAPPAPKPPKPVPACSVDGCERRGKIVRGMCAMHYERFRRHGDPAVNLVRRYPDVCGIDGCDRRHAEYGYCSMHAARFRRHGDPMVTTRGSGECLVPGCGRRRASREGYCGSHKERLRRLGDPLMHIPIGEIPSRPCKSTYKDADGYVFEYDPTNPMARKPKGYVYQHRKVISDLLGRPLYRHETVHHINGVRGDNRPENLELWSSLHPSGQRVTDKVEWAVEMLRIYAPERLAEEPA